MVEGFLAGDGAAVEDVGQVGVAEAEVFAQEVGGEAEGEAGLYAVDGV